MDELIQIELQKRNELQNRLKYLEQFYNINEPIFQLDDETDIYTISCYFDKLMMESYVKLDRRKEDYELDAKLILVEKLNNVINKYIEWKRI
jgi:hypothetical protein